MTKGIAATFLRLIASVSIIFILVQSKPGIPEVLINNILESDYRDDNPSSSEEDMTTVRGPGRYVKFLNDQFNEINPKYTRQNAYAGTKHTLFEALLPVNITRDEGPGLIQTVIFQQELPRYKYGEFSSSQITLTLKNSTKGVIPKQTYIHMYGSWKDRQQHQQTAKVTLRRQIFANVSFYSFNITEMMRNTLVHNISHPTFFSFKFDVFQKINGKGRQLLDVAEMFEMEETTIIFFFTDFIPTEANAYRRIRRSAKANCCNHNHSKTTIRCQRLEFIATPDDFSFNNIVFPTSFDLGMCVGSCPFPIEDQSYNFSTHTFLMDRIRHKKPHNLPLEFPHSRCYPIEYKDVYVLERDEETPTVIRQERIDEMSVARCGCR